jgi:hypothetical protein
MAKTTKHSIQTHAVATLGDMPSDQRAEALAEAVDILIRATNEAAADVSLEWEPARFLTVMNQTAER